jgi:hypothetical protein
MKIFKKIILALLIIVAIALIAGLFMTKDYAIEKEILVNKPKDSVFNYAKYLKNQDHYSVWNMKDPKMEKMYSGIDGTVGFIAGWNSKDKNIGVGEQEIKSIKDGERLDLELRFKVPFEATDNAYMITEAVSSSQTKVIWGFKGKMSYPMNIMLPIMGIEEMLGKDLQEGLVNLKTILEKK